MNLKQITRLQCHTLPNFDFDIASSVADSASCMKTIKKGSIGQKVKKNITKDNLRNKGK